MYFVLKKKEVIDKKLKTVIILNREDTIVQKCMHSFPDTITKITNVSF